jgi:hypothetical protein
MRLGELQLSALSRLMWPNQMIAKSLSRCESKGLGQAALPAGVHRRGGNQRIGPCDWTSGASEFPQTAGVMRNELVDGAAAWVDTHHGGASMIHSRLARLSVFGLASAAWIPVLAQSVISTHSGLVYFFEGSVYIESQRLEQKFGRFPDIGQGRELRTERGRAEVLLTPGVILRIGKSSAIRMRSILFSDTCVELLGGSSILEANEPRTVKISKCTEGSRSSMMNIEDEHNHMGAALSLRDRIGQPRTSAAE